MNLTVRVNQKTKKKFEIQFENMSSYLYFIKKKNIYLAIISQITIELEYIIKLKKKEKNILSNVEINIKRQLMES